LFAEAAPKAEEGFEPEPVTAAPADEALFELLGLSPSASLEEVRAAYRKKMKEWHPDVFAGRSDEARRVAEEKTRDIIEAYQILLARYRRQREETAVA
jgi:curved DNA-binding protein CbpA